MNVQTITTDQLQSLVSGHTFVKIMSEQSFNSVKNIIDNSHMIAFLQYCNMIYVDGIYYGIPSEQIEQIRTNTENIRNMQDPEYDGSLAYQISKLEERISYNSEVISNITEGENSIYNQLNDAVEELTNKINSSKTSIQSLSTDVVISYESSYNGTSYSISLAYDITPKQEFIELYERLYGDKNQSGSIAYISKEILKNELIPEDAQEALDTLEEISKWIQEHPDQYTYIIDDITTLQEDVETTYQGLQDLAYDLSRLNIDELITVEVNAAANKIESISVNDEIQNIYEYDENNKKNVNINIPITSIYDTNTGKLLDITDNTAYIDAHDVLKDTWIILSN